MAIVWLIILLLYGIAAGFGHIPFLMWLLLLVFLGQDQYDVRRNRRR